MAVARVALVLAGPRRGAHAVLLVRSKQRTARRARERSQAENGSFMLECRLRKTEHERHFCSKVSFMLLRRCDTSPQGGGILNAKVRMPVWGSKCRSLKRDFATPSSPPGAAASMWRRTCSTRATLTRASSGRA